MLQFFAHPFDALAKRTASGKRMGQPALRFRLGLFERKLRITSGLILFAFAASHFTNHAFGIFRLGAIEAVRHAISKELRLMRRAGLIEMRRGALVLPDVALIMRKLNTPTSIAANSAKSPPGDVRTCL
jgi:hypothetical protein